MGILQLSEEEITRRLREHEIRICVLGLGRIGLPMATLFAEAGAYVVGVDINPRIVHEVNSGKCRFTDEPDLGYILQRVVSSSRLVAKQEADDGVADADCVIVCVPTPVDETKTPDYSCIVKACQDVGRSLKQGCLVIIESTVGPGVVEDLIRSTLESISGLKAGRDFGLASCPERSDPGNVVRNIRSVPRVIGSIDKASTDAAAALYNASFGVQIVRVSSPKVANAVKLTENLFRDVNIALANEFALLYEKLGVDAIEVIDACATKYNFMPHYPGPGVGGPCLPANPYYLIVEGVKVGNIPYLVRMAREINDRMPDHVVNLVCDALNETSKTVKGSKIAVLGVAYKPDVKDIQLTPFARIVQQLRTMGASLSVYDPYFKGEQVLGTLVGNSVEEAVRDADCVIIGTAHKEFFKLDLASIHQHAHNQAAFVDTRNVVSRESVRSFGFIYRGVGRPKKGNLS